MTSHLQRIQNYAARVILCLPRSSSITIHSKSPHCLPVKVRSTYKIACFCAITATAVLRHHMSLTCCIESHHTPATLAPAHTRLPLLNRPAHSRGTLGDRSFSFASSSVWNSIPNDVICAHHCHHMSLV